MIRGRYFAALLAVAASCVSFTAYGQNPADKSGAASFSLALNLGGLPAAEPITAPAPVPAPAATPAVATAGTPAINSTISSATGTSSGLSTDTPWFQRFLLPVPEANATVDNWLPCSRPGVMANVDYLNWQARRSGMDFAYFADVANAPVVASKSLDDFDRASGFRGGVGYSFGNGWKVAWTYTYFQTSANPETVVATLADPKLFASQSYLLTNATFIALKGNMTSVEADGSMLVKIQDFDAQWSSCLNDTVGFTAFGGIRWAKIDQNFNMAYAYFGGFDSGTINLPNNMDAGGLRLGAELQWRSTCGVQVFGRAAESVLVADFETVQHELDPPPTPVAVQGININAPNTTTTVVPVFEAAVGVAYARGPWEFRAGYEMSDWFNLVQVNKPAQSLLLDGYFLSLSFSR